MNHDRHFHTESARITRQLRAAAVIWMTVRENVPEEIRSATMETLRLQLMAMIIDFIPRVGDQSDAAGNCPYVSEDDGALDDVRLTGGREPDESDEEGRDARRASIHTGGPVHRHFKRPRGHGETTSDEWHTSYGRRIRAAGRR